MVATPTEITDRYVHHYASELIVELTGVDEDGVVVVLSYGFEYTDGREVVEPKGRIDPAYEPHVRECLENHGYVLVDSAEPSGAMSD